MKKEIIKRSEALWFNLIVALLILFLLVLAIFSFFATKSIGSLLMVIVFCVFLFFIIRRLKNLKSIYINTDILCVSDFWTRKENKTVRLSEIRKLIVKTRADGPMIPKYCMVILDDDSRFSFSITGIYKMDLYPFFTAVGVEVFDQLGDGKLKRYS